MTRHFVVALCVLARTLPAFAQNAQDEGAVRARIAAYADARNKRDAHAEALCYTEDGDFRSSQGPLLVADYVVVKQESDWLIASGRVATKPARRP